MFDIGWSELLIIGVIAILVVGPRDLPRMMRTVGQYVSKMRSMGRELQRQFDSAMREAELDEVRKSVTDLGKTNPMRDIREAVTKPLKSASEGLSRAASETARSAEDAQPPASPAATQAGDGSGEATSGDPVDQAGAASTPEPAPAETATAEPQRAATGS